MDTYLDPSPPPLHLHVDTHLFISTWNPKISQPATFNPSTVYYQKLL